MDETLAVEGSVRVEYLRHIRRILCERNEGMVREGSSIGYTEAEGIKLGSEIW